MPCLVLMKWAPSPFLRPRLPALRAQGRSQGPFCREPHGCPQGLPSWARIEGAVGLSTQGSPLPGSAILPSRPQGWGRSLMSLQEAGSSWSLLGRG